MLADLDELRELLAKRLLQLGHDELGRGYSRSSAIRYAIRWTLEDVRRAAEASDARSAVAGGG